MSNKIQIYLDDYNDFCIPGQTINGRLVCDFTSERQIRAILVNFTGKCNTSWSESESYNDHISNQNRTDNVYYTGEEIYFDDKVNLAGGSNQDTFVLPIGRHVYNFSYKLPEHLPSTYDSPNGWGNVQYRINAIVDSPWKFNMKAAVILNLISPLDLNFVPGVKEPVEVSMEKVVCSCWCNCSDVLTFTFSLASTGCVPGQAVRVGVYIQNLTNVSVEQVKFKITESTEYVTTSPRTSIKYNKEVIVDCVEGGVGAHSEKSWTTILDIPQHKYFPNLVPCNLINKSYKIQGEAVLPCPKSNLTGSVPIIIGQVQLTGVDGNAVLGPPPTDRTLMLSNSDRRNYGSIEPTAPLHSMEQQMPPSYEEVQKTLSG